MRKLTLPEMEDVVIELGGLNRKAQYMMDEVMCAYFECANPEQPTNEQVEKIAVEFERLWVKLGIINDILLNMSGAIYTALRPIVKGCTE